MRLESVSIDGVSQYPTEIRGDLPKNREGGKVVKWGEKEKETHNPPQS